MRTETARLGRSAVMTELGLPARLAVSFVKRRSVRDGAMYTSDIAHIRCLKTVPPPLGRYAEDIRPP